MLQPRPPMLLQTGTATYQVLRAVQVDGAPGARALAMVHVSMADAINTVQNRYTLCLSRLRAVFRLGGG
jgi:hypothetical protein